MKKIILSFAFIALSLVSVQAQTKFEVPTNVQLKSGEDYAKYETAIIEAAKWLEETDLNKEAEKRQNVNAFVVQWVSGSPDITVSITEQLGKIYGENNQLLALYLASYTRNFLENKSNASLFSATKAGLISIMNVYKKGIAITKSKEMEKIIKLNDENKLDDYINSKLL